MNRFDALYSLIEPGNPLWDVGCDHGLLGLRALSEGRVPTAYFVDQSPSAVEALKAKARDSRARVIQSRGEDLDWNLVEGTVILAGLGQNTIQKITSKVPAEVSSRVRLVLCAEKDPEELRTGLDESGWRLVPSSEHLCFDKGRYRLVFAVDRGHGPRLAPFGNDVFVGEIGMDYLKFLLLLWRDSKNKQFRRASHYEHLLELGRRIGGFTP